MSSTNTQVHSFQKCTNCLISLLSRASNCLNFSEFEAGQLLSNCLFFRDFEGGLLIKYVLIKKTECILCYLSKVLLRYFWATKTDMYEWKFSPPRTKTLFLWLKEVQSLKERLSYIISYLLFTIIYDVYKEDV